MPQYDVDDNVWQSLQVVGSGVALVEATNTTMMMFHLR
jgi:hypothetical protein